MKTLGSSIKTIALFFLRQKRSQQGNDIQTFVVVVVVVAVAVVVVEKGLLSSLFRQEPLIDNHKKVFSLLL